MSLKELLEKDEEFDPEDYDDKCISNNNKGQAHCTANSKALFDFAENKSNLVKSLKEELKNAEEYKGRIGHLEGDVNRLQGELSNKDNQLADKDRQLE